MDPSCELNGYHRLMLLISIHLTSSALVSSHICRISDDKKFANCSNLGLTEIPNHFPRSVKQIDLSNNYIKKVPNKAFHKLLFLRSVILDNNNIKQLKSKAFIGPLSLEYLSLRNNSLKLDNVSFHQNVFKPLTNLHTLDISNNLKRHCKILELSQPQHYPDEEFGYLRKLRRLTIDLYPLPVFGEGFRKMQNLDSIIFDKCFLRRLENSTFQNISVSIREFHMTNCFGIGSRIGIAAFEHFTKLRVLNLRATQISLTSALLMLYSFRNRTMDVIDFYQVNSNLLLNGNQDAVILTENITVYLKTICVKKLNLGFNAIVQVKRKSFFELSRFAICVEHLVLSGNSVHSISDLKTEIFALLFFASRLNIQTIEYSYAPVEFPVYYVAPSHFAIEKNETITRPTSYAIDSGCEKTLAIPLPPKLKTILLSHVIGYINLCNVTLHTNNVETFDFSYTLLQNAQLMINGLTNIRNVDVSGIDIAKSLLLFFESIPNVRNLIAEDTNLDRFFSNTQTKNIFQHNTKIESFDISYNHLTEVPCYLTSKMENLKSINLSFNLLKEFPSILLESKNLSSIDLSNNKLLGLNKTVTDWLDKQNTEGQMKIYLQGNVMLCTCDYMHFINWLIQTDVWLDHGGNYICTLTNGTQSTTGKVKRNFHEIFINCKSKFWLIFSIVFVCIVTLVLIASIISFRLRWRILYFFYRHCYSGYRHLREADDMQYDYDAFVAYSGDEYEWICSKFRQTLEVDNSLKLCLHDRDFAVGESILQNIINSICKSRKVIIDATPGYLRSRWFEFEVEMSKLEMFDRPYENGVIVIIRNGTKPSDMPSLLKSIWKSITCVIFEEGDTEDIFFRRLVTALKD